MKIVVDDQIPLVDELFGRHFNLVKKPGDQIGSADLMDAEMLWVRTLTQVNEKLLKNTSVRFVGTATAGFDHIDTNWLEHHGIAWANTPGANAQAVSEYVLSCLAALQVNGIRDIPLRAAVIGVGHVGTMVASYLQSIGCQVLLNDPPREQQQKQFISTPLSAINDVDLISVHAALHQDEPFPSYHLLTHEFLQRQKPGCILINAARGAVIDTQVLLKQSHLHLCLDVWENEPEINLQLLRQATIATPHIAGYSQSAKYQASQMLYQRAQAFFEWEARAATPIVVDSQLVIPSSEMASCLSIYNPIKHTEQVRQALLRASSPASEFLKLRKAYPWRGSFPQLIANQ